MAVGRERKGETVSGSWARRWCGSEHCQYLVGSGRVMGVAEEGVGEIGGAYVHRAFLLNFNVFVRVGIYFCWRVLSVEALTTCDGVHRNRQAWPLSVSTQPNLQCIRVLKCDSFTQGIPFLTGRHHCVQSLNP